MTRRLLIVDDEDDIREVAAMSLEGLQGWEVLQASSGDQAVQVARTARPDAVLLDVMMPGRDGPATLDALRRHEETRLLPVVFLTAKAQASERRSLEDLGVAGVLTKPFDPMQLGDDLARLLGWT